MKKIVLMFLLMLFSFNNINAYEPPASIYINWTLIGKPSWTTPSFYYCVTRSSLQIDGYYYFHIFFTSNTYTWDYYRGVSSWRYVQMDDCKVSYDGYLVNRGVPVSFSFIKNFCPESLSWRTTNPNPIFKIYWYNYYTL